MGACKLFIFQICCSLIIALVVGSFVWSLHILSAFREENLGLIYFLPFAGAVMTILFMKWGPAEFSEDSEKLFERVQKKPNTPLPSRLDFFAYVSTNLTHLFGGSAGREGAALQISASSVDRLSRLFKLNQQHRQNAFLASLGAGFSVAVGAPLAGLFFACEIGSVHHKKMTRFFHQGGLWWIVVFVGFSELFSRLLQVPHMKFQNNFSGDMIPQWSVLLILQMALLAVGLTIFTLFLRQLTVSFKRLLAMISQSNVMQTFLGGILISGLLLGLNLESYAGLGIPEIYSFFQTSPDLQVPILKLIFTALTSASGLKGGEFIPSVFIGTSFGGALGDYLALSSSFLAAISFGVIYGSLTRTPWACAIMTGELMGWLLFPYALVVGLLSALLFKWSMMCFFNKRI